MAIQYLGNSCKQMIKHRYAKQIIAAVVVVALAILIPLIIRNKNAIRNFFHEIIDHPDRNSMKALLFAALCGAVFLALIFVIQKLCKKYILKK